MAFGKGQNKPKVQYHNPPNVLRQRVGYGGIDTDRLERAEQVIDDNQFDFLPYAKSRMNALAKLIQTARSKDVMDRKVLDPIIAEIMFLKANGGMFHYELVSDIAGIILNFMENLQEMNQDSFTILDVHQQALKIILENDLKGHGGRIGQELADELRQACHRYNRKHRIFVDVPNT